MKGRTHCDHLTDLDLHPDLVAKVADLERELGIELVVSRGADCVLCNTEAGGKDLSAHTPSNNESGKGEAIDFHVNAVNVFPIVAKMISKGFTGIGIKRPSGSEGFVHGDIAVSSDKRPRPRLWTYP